VRFSVAGRVMFEKYLFLNDISPFEQK